MIGSYRIAGVGGQGVITLGKAISSVLMLEDLDPVMSEIHGLSQRGGSVVSDIKFGGAKSAILMGGDAEFLIGLKTAEALSNMYILKEGGICIANRNNTVGQKVVKEITEGKETYWVDCGAISGQNSRGNYNMILLGFLCAADSRMPMESALKYIKSNFREGDVERNTELLRKGFDAASSSMLAAK